jgi:hypothetical protein
VGGESGLVFPQIRVIVVSQPIDDIQHQELAEQLGAVGFQPVLFDTRPWSGLPGGLKAIANRLDSTEGGREAPYFWPVHAHSDTSFEHVWRVEDMVSSGLRKIHDQPKLGFGIRSTLPGGEFSRIFRSRVGFGTPLLISFVGAVSITLIQDVQACSRSLKSHARSTLALHWRKSHD